MLKKILNAITARTAPVYTLIVEHPLGALSFEDAADLDIRELEDAVQAQVVGSYHVLRKLRRSNRGLLGTTHVVRQEDGFLFVVGARCLVNVADDSAAMDLIDLVKAEVCEHSVVRMVPGDLRMEREA